MASVDTQVLVSTQSASLLDHFEPEDVLVADRVDGGTQLSLTLAVFQVRKRRASLVQ
jgi:predicted ATPase